MWSIVARSISEATGKPFVPEATQALGGGCINTTVVLSDEHRRFFVKHNRASLLSMFEAEAEGLRELASAHAVRVPLPICWGTAADQAYLVLEYVEMRNGDIRSAERLGQDLAKLHATRGEHFGWRQDNTIGETPQINTPASDWVDFWRVQRLGYQLQLAARNGYGGALQRNAETLLTDVGVFFSSYRPFPSLLHGDLWGGNWADDTTGRPVIFDPAVYYGDHEADLAMTELFGGFPSRFYDAYKDTFPLDPGYRVRKILYNLYHVLNHLNLFGGGYGAQAARMVEQLLAEIR